MEIYKNPLRGTGIDGTAPYPSDDVAPVTALLQRCPAYKETPLVSADALAAQVGVSSIYIKDERTRMGLGSFKALGAAYVIAHEAASKGGDIAKALAGKTYVTSSAGNHGMSVAAGARLFGAKAVIYLSEAVPEVFADRLRALDAEVVREGADYEASMVGAMRDGAANGWQLLSDTSWPEYLEIPHRLMQGYLQMGFEAGQQIGAAPSHIFLQAGVGGLACAMAAYARRIWGDDPVIVVVEPVAAPALIESVKAGAVVNTTGPTSNMGRLDCKEPSLIALRGLSRDADYFVTITDEQADARMPDLTAVGLETTQSGGAGVVALMDIDLGAVGLTADSRVLCYLSEEPE